MDCCGSSYPQQGNISAMEWVCLSMVVDCLYFNCNDLKLLDKACLVISYGLRWKS